MTHFPSIFSPLRIGTLELKNRLYVPPMETNLGFDTGFVSDDQIRYYTLRARGGYGLVIVAFACVDYPEGKSESLQPSIDDDKYIPGLAKIAASVKGSGARVALQLTHCGAETTKAKSGIQPAGPSAVKSFTGEMSRELTIDEIHTIVGKFAEGAMRAKKAGYDAIEIHGATWYLVSQFLSSYYNKRQDMYGGNLENRARFMIEVITAIRKSVGPNFPMWIRLNAKQFGVEGGITLEETKKYAQFAEEAGSDAIHVSTFGATEAPEMGTPIEPNLIVPLAAEIKKVVHVPVMVIGRVDIFTAESSVRDHKVDMVGTGRASIADPELPNKMAAGQVSDIRPCIACLECLNHVLYMDARVECTVNGMVGFEDDINKRAHKHKKVLVIGGGPAGMEAARVAALRGHEVTLYEKSHRLGGKALLAGILDPQIEKFINYLRRQVVKAGVQVKLGSEATLGLIEQNHPDVVIVSAGSVPVIPEILGVNGRNVVSTLDVLRMASGQLTWGSLKNRAGVQKLMWWIGNALIKYLPSGAIRLATRLWLPFGKTVIVIGGDMAGCQFAEYLVEKGRKVIVVEKARLATDMGAIKRAVLFRKLRERGATLLSGIKEYREITHRGLIIIDKEGKQYLIEADTVVVVATHKPANSLFNTLGGKVSEIYTAGDSVEPHHILEAIRDGSRVGREI